MDPLLWALRPVAPAKLGLRYSHHKASSHIANTTAKRTPATKGVRMIERLCTGYLQGAENCLERV